MLEPIHEEFVTCLKKILSESRFKNDKVIPIDLVELCRVYNSFLFKVTL